MRIGKVGDVNIVPNTCAVRRVVIGAKNADMVALAQGCLNRNLDEMRGTCR